MLLRLIWDEPKRLANIAKHELDFSALTEAFFLGAHVVPARSPRSKAIGLLGKLAIVVIFAPLGAEAFTIISMRAASRKERSIL